MKIYGKWRSRRKIFGVGYYGKWQKNRERKEGKHLACKEVEGGRYWERENIWSEEENKNGEGKERNNILEKESDDGWTYKQNFLL